MLTLEKLRFGLLESINQYSDDSTLTYRLLDQYIEEYRVKWFELEFNKFNKVVPNVYYQTLSCLEQNEESLYYYKIRSTLEGFQEEKFHAFLNFIFSQ